MLRDDDADDGDRRGLVWSCPSSLIRLKVDVDAVDDVVSVRHGHAGIGLSKSTCGTVFPHLVQVHVLSAVVVAFDVMVVVHGHC